MDNKISLFDLTLDNLFLREMLDKYNFEFDGKATIGDNLYNYLTSNEGLIQHRKHVDYPLEKKKNYQDEFRQVVSKGSPLIIFFSSFSPKITNIDITNNHFLPDMGDLLTFVHLHLLAKHVRSIYDYGFRFIIAYKGNLYKRVMGWNNEIVDKTFTILKELISHAERITGIRNVVELVDFMELVKKENDYFQIQWDEEVENVRVLYQKGDQYIVRKINGWLRDYKRSSNPKLFSNRTEFDRNMFEHALKIRALKQIQYKGGDKGVGICNSLPPTIRTTVRGLDPVLSLQLNPYFRFHSHQRLLALSNSKEWYTFEWKEEHKSLLPIYSKEYEHPFYYIQKPSF